MRKIIPILLALILLAGCGTVNMKTLYVTDLDGTLLNSKSRISSYSMEIIHDLVDKGMLFTYAAALSKVGVPFAVFIKIFME